MNEKLRHLDLFSGIGGFALGLESTGGFETIGFCDNEPFAQKVLKKHWPHVPCFGDVRDVGRDTTGLDRVDIITGGFPCQSISVAGLQKATEDNRWLWPEMFRIIKEIRPTYVIGENVRNLISIRDGVVFEQVCTDLESEGYEVQTYVLSASAVNAPHQRYRCWIVAHAKSSRYRGRSSEECRDKQGKFQQSKQRWSEVGSKVERCSEPHGEKQNWETEPRILRMADGISNWVDRLKGLGNAVIPQIPAALGRAILEVHND